MTKITVSPTIRLELLNNLLGPDNFKNLSPELKAWCAKALGMKDWKKYQKTMQVPGYFDSGRLEVKEGGETIFIYRVTITDIKDGIKVKLPKIIYEVQN